MCLVLNLCVVWRWSFGLPHLINVSLAWLRLTGRLKWHRATVDRPLGSLSVDNSRIVVSWSPPFGLDEGLAETVRHS